LILPATAFLGRSPALAILNIVAAMAVLGIGVVAHALTLPVEYDASFNKALPILEGRRYLSERDMPAARHVLKAAAYTYVAAALATLLNIARWVRLFR